MEKTFSKHKLNFPPFYCSETKVRGVIVRVIHARHILTEHKSSNSLFFYVILETEEGRRLPKTKAILLKNGRFKCEAYQTLCNPYNDKLYSEIVIHMRMHFITGDSDFSKFDLPTPYKDIIGL